MRSKLVKVVLLYIIQITLLNIDHVNAQTQYRKTFCQGETMSFSCGESQSITIFSVNIFSNPNSTQIENVCLAAIRDAPCVRSIRAGGDQPSQEYKYFYNTIRGVCSGKMNCNVDMPSKNSLIGETAKANNILASKKHTCPTDDNAIKLFVGILIHYQCQLGVAPTYPIPANTTTQTTPTTPAPTTPFAVIVDFYNPSLRDREKIVLGVAIGLAIVILIVLLLILYCWETVRNQKKFRKLLQMLGRPTEDADAYDEFEDYARADAWKDETDNAEALGEYTGVKPDEFMTIDKKHMETSGMIISDSCGTLTLGKGNSCSTLTRNGGGGSRNLPTVTVDAPSGPVDYGTAENLELEERMAAAMAGGPVLQNDDEMTSKH